MVKPVWLDVDPGHDDAIAILLATMFDQLEILGISTVHGNTSALNTWKNTLRLLYAFGVPCGKPHVYPGASKPLLRSVKADIEIHGEDGLGGVEDLLPSFADPRVQARAQSNHLHAIEAMAMAIQKTWNEGRGRKTTLVTTGPQTNLALFLSVYPQLQPAIEEIVFMGGAAGLGNRSAVAEYNILCDPEASQIILDFPVRKVMIPINVTHQVIYTKEIHDRLISAEGAFGGTKACTPLRRLLSCLLTYFSETYKSTFGFDDGPPLHDPLTIAYILHPEYFTCKRYRVDVERSGVFSTGATVVDIWNYRSCDDSWGHTGKNCLVAETVDVPKFFDLFLEAVRVCDLKSPLNTISDKPLIYNVSNESNNYHLHFAPMTSTEEPVTSNDAVDSNNPGKFEWQQDYEDTLEQVAKTDHVDVSWLLLRNIIRYKIDLNVQDFLSKKADGEKMSSQPSEVTTQSFSLQSSSPPTPSTVPPLQGIIIPPFPKRGQTKNPILRLFNSTMDEKEAESVKQHILLQLDNFDELRDIIHPLVKDLSGSTKHRLCELCLWPRKHHKTVGKYLRALERVVRVTSTKLMYSSEEVEEGQQPTLTHYPESATLKIATTPVFSPIPFLHLDARRSRSPSPFELSATQHPEKLAPKEPSTSPPKGLGLVDELDDPKPGHLADHPTPLTSVTKIPPLSKRFVKAPPDEDIVMQDNNNNNNNEKESRPSEDAEVEGMVLDPEEQNK